MRETKRDTEIEDYRTLCIETHNKDLHDDYCRNSQETPYDNIPIHNSHSLRQSFHHLLLPLHVHLPLILILIRISLVEWCNLLFLLLLLFFTGDHHDHLPTVVVAIIMIFEQWSSTGRRRELPLDLILFFPPPPSFTRTTGARRHFPPLGFFLGTT